MGHQPRAAPARRLAFGQGLAFRVAHLDERWFTGAELAEELGDGEMLLDGDRLVVVRAPAVRPARAPARP